MYIVSIGRFLNKIFINIFQITAAFWAICMVIFLQTVPDNEPKWQASNGLIGVSPGVGLRPKNSEDLIDSAIIMFNTESQAARTDKQKLTDKVASYQEWTARITDFLKAYKDETKYKHRVDCSKKDKKVTSTHGCKFDVAPLENHCGGKGFGYDKGSPCVFLKLNRIFGLENSPYNVSDLPQDLEMPDDLLNHIKAQSDKDQVWVNCQGKYPADKEMLAEKDAITYFPESKGFPSKYFPYQNQEDYLSPLVAVKFTPSWKKKEYGVGQLIHIECRAWAENIGYNRRDKIGISVFELHIMDQDATDKYNGKQVEEITD